MRIPFQYLQDEADEALDEEIINATRQEIGPELPQLSNNVMEWITQARPMLGKRKRNLDLIPFWVEIFEDNHPNIMVKAARQTYKTTSSTDIIACAATSNEGVEITYTADNNPHRSAFSKQRLRTETFKANPTLKQFLPGQGRAAVEEITLENDTVIYLTTDEGEYKNVEGKSNHIWVCDEFQYHDVQYLYKGMYTLSETHGRFYGFGIGGEQGSPYSTRWEQTDQREWVYDDPDWRSRLTFDSMGSINNTSTQLKSILAGRWVAQKPENTQFRGYHIPQTIVPSKPLTIESAINDYHTQPENSIEYQQKYFPQNIYLSHTLAEDYKAERRPLTPQMIKDCMDPHYRFLKDWEVRELKEIFGNEIKVCGGVDFGSSTATPTTVASVNIYWRKSRRMQIAYMEYIPQSDHPMDKAQRIAGIFQSYGCDMSVGDWGHGADMIPAIQKGGRNSKDEKFQGLGKNKFKGCRSIGDETKPMQQNQVKINEDGNKELDKILIDKTTSLQNFISIFGTYVTHPRYPQDQSLKKHMYIIPSQVEWETDQLLTEWPKLTRKDLKEDPDDQKEDTRTNVKKEFNHPPDSLMSQIYCMVANNASDTNAFSVRGI